MMLILPNEKQLQEIIYKSKGGNKNYLRDWLNKKRKRISVKLLHKYLIDLTEEQEEYIQAKRLIERMNK